MVALGLRCCAGFSLTVVSYSSLWYTDFSLQWLLCPGSPGSRRMGFSSCDTWTQQLRLRGLVAPWHVGSFWTGDWTHVLCTGRWILFHCTTKEVQGGVFCGLQLLQDSVMEEAKHLNDCTFNFSRFKLQGSMENRQAAAARGCYTKELHPYVWEFFHVSYDNSC